MKISDLASIVAVRNHINVVMNDKSVTTKDDFKHLNDARNKLDKKFVAELKNDIEDFFSNDLLIVKVGDSENIPTAKTAPIDIDTVSVPQTPEQTTIELSNGGNIKITSKETISIKGQLSLPLNEEPKVCGFLEPSELNDNDDKYKKTEKSVSDEESELALIAERVKAQKELLKKQGRSNKRVSKAKEDADTK
jgi:hypothetical protein